MWRCSSNAAVMRDLPRPGSPEISTTWPSPALARAQRRNSRSISSSRPTSGVSADPRKASNRLATALGRSTCHADTGLGDALELNLRRDLGIRRDHRQPAGARGDHDSVRLGQGLQAGGEVGRFADDHRAAPNLADQIADDNQPGGNPDPRLQLCPPDLELRRPRRPAPTRIATARSASSSCACG